MSVCISRERKSIFYLPKCVILIITSYRENFSLIEENSFPDPFQGHKQKATGLYRTLTVRHLTYFLFRLVRAVPPTPVLRPLPHDTHLPHHQYPYHYQSHEDAYTVLL